MKRALAFVLAFSVSSAQGWEADTTHAGLTEQAALISRVHVRLQAFFARSGGWLEPLRFAPSRAPALYAKLGLLEPTSGVVPDRTGRQSAISWLLAGSVVEGMPGSREENHFYDPIAKKGLTGRQGAPITVAVETGVTGVGGTGVPAPDWINAKENDLGVARFWIELEKSVTSVGPAERDEHLAMALLCAGALMHVLEDLGEPARTRGDLDEFLLPLGGGPGDRGSRFERLAGALFGRLGVPAPLAPIPRPRLRDYYTAADHQGLADITNAHWYSSGTMPGEIVIPAHPRPGDLAALIGREGKYPSPKPLRDPVVTGGNGGPDGLAIRDENGVCLANYRISDEAFRFSISDDCAESQLRVILPTIGGYAAGLLEHLFRGGLAVTVDAGRATVSVPATEAQLGPGQLIFIAEDGSGRRKIIGNGDLGAGSTSFDVPADATRVFVVFKGADAAGEPLIAVGTGAAR